MITIGHHACSNEGGRAHILKNAPFISSIPIVGQKGKSFPFLGAGFYFWDNDLPQAKWWGQKQYPYNFVVLEAHLELTTTTCYDLVGNRNHMIDFQEKIKAFKAKFNKNWKIGQLIELLKKEDIFNFESIRAQDYLPSRKQNKQYFVDGKSNFTDLEPSIIICVIRKDSSTLLSRKIIYP